VGLRDVGSHEAAEGDGVSPKPIVEADLYANAGPEFRDAFAKMCDQIKLPHIPPSLDVFEHELGFLNRQADKSHRCRLTPMELADKIIARPRQAS
jgi:hypothetical protein